MDLMQQLYEAVSGAGLWERERKVAKGELLVKAGRIDSAIYFVRKGTFRIFVCDGDKELTVRFGYSNNFITALDCFISGKPTLFNIEALRKAEVSIVPKDDFVSFCSTNEKAGRLWDQLLQSLVYQQLEREIDILITSPEERYRRVLERSPQLFQEVPNKYIASYLRMAPETLSRLSKS